MTPEPATRTTTPVTLLPPHPAPPMTAGMPLPTALTYCVHPDAPDVHVVVPVETPHTLGAAGVGESVVKAPAVPPAAPPEYAAADTVMAVAPDAAFFVYWKTTWRLDQQPLVGATDTKKSTYGVAVPYAASALLPVPPGKVYPVKNVPLYGATGLVPYEARNVQTTGVFRLAG